MKKRFHLPSRLLRLRTHSSLFLFVVAAVIIIVPGFLVLRGGNPKTSELAFTEKSSISKNVGSVVPASCDSNGISSFDHFGYIQGNPGRQNFDTTYDVKPCPPTSCAAGQTLTQKTKYYCDYTSNPQTSENAPASGYRIATGLGWTGNRCPEFYANSILFDTLPNCAFTFQADPDGLGMCQYYVNTFNVTVPAPKSITVNTCVTPTVNLAFTQTPSSPKNVTRTCSAYGTGYSPMKLSWSPASGATSYLVRIHDDTDSNPNSYTTWTSTGPSVDVGGLWRWNNPTYTATVYSMPGMVSDPARSVLANFKCP